MVIADKYRLLRHLGTGAMGVVWAAINEATGREVALKLIVAPVDALRRRVEREAHACGALRHPNIVDIYDAVHTAEGDPVLVLQLLQGETLADLLTRRRRLEPELAAHIGREIAAALTAVHALGIVHRDLKPANIFLHREHDGGTPVVKVLDFGVSKPAPGRTPVCTAPGDAVGSLPYMSPEQVRAAVDVDLRADIWSLGVVLFEMLTGERPFQGNFSEIVLQILQGQVPRVSRYVRHVDPEFVDLVAGCMRRQRELRLGPAEHIVRGLDRLVGDVDPWSLPLGTTAPRRSEAEPCPELHRQHTPVWNTTFARSTSPGWPAAQPPASDRPRETLLPDQDRVRTRIGFADPAPWRLNAAEFSDAPPLSWPEHEPPGLPEPPPPLRQSYSSLPGAQRRVAWEVPPPAEPDPQRNASTFGSDADPLVHTGPRGVAASSAEAELPTRAERTSHLPDLSRISAIPSSLSDRATQNSRTSIGSMSVPDSRRSLTARLPGLTTHWRGALFISTIATLLAAGAVSALISAFPLGTQAEATLDADADGDAEATGPELPALAERCPVPTLGATPARPSRPLRVPAALAATTLVAIPPGPSNEPESDALTEPAPPPPAPDQAEARASTEALEPSMSDDPPASEPATAQADATTQAGASDAPATPRASRGPSASAFNAAPIASKSSRAGAAPMPRGATPSRCVNPQFLQRARCSKQPPGRR
ncbi:uncharacterized protein CMC5_031770 [Chondromyces crocatus]|uniref:Protein kinase domain-containing protein n=2 Tax=Chondromyces crocatus TaxID=52 RepID=A0A0K1EDT4_CHOCO|nr:uncharacterized protein CMC5_031770 [Chondromyces crocatus]